jgi:hypothetical protein
VLDAKPPFVLLPQLGGQLLLFAPFEDMFGLPLNERLIVLSEQPRTSFSKAPDEISGPLPNNEREHLVPGEEIFF